MNLFYSMLMEKKIITPSVFMLETKFNHPQKALFARRVMNSSPESSQASMEASGSDRSPYMAVPAFNSPPSAYCLFSAIFTYQFGFILKKISMCIWLNITAKCCLRTQDCPSNEEISYTNAAWVNSMMHGGSMQWGWVNAKQDLGIQRIFFSNNLVDLTVSL